MTHLTFIRGMRWAMLATAGLALSGCNAMSNSPPNGATQASVSPSYKLPEGKSCSGAVEKWQAVTQSDYTTGNVNPSVYKQIQGDIAKAADACSAGRDAEARAIVSASRRKHGYPS